MVVFDMAGTTVDEQNLVYKTLHEAILDGGLSVDFSEVLRLGAGREKKDAIATIMKQYETGPASELTDRIYDDFMQRLEIAYRNAEVIPEPGAEALFDWLRSEGVYVVLNTGYSHETADRLMEKLHWHVPDTVDALVTASEVEAARPAPDMIRLAMDQFGIDDGGEVVKVGDSMIDIEEGKNALCALTIGITTGAHTREQLQSVHPDYVIDHLLEIKELLADRI